MSTLLIILMIISGIIFTVSVLLMSPKGGLGLGIGGINGSNEYGSKKSLEGKLKNISIFMGVIFIITSIILPYTLG